MKPTKTRMLPVVTSVAALAMNFAGQSVRAATPEVTTVPVPSGGEAIVAKGDARGTIHLVLNSSDGPHYVSCLTPDPSPAGHWYLHILVPGLCPGTRCLAGSACRQ